MIKIENTQVVGLDAAIRGMRNPMNSWDKSDSFFMTDDGDAYDILENTRPWPSEYQGSTILGDADHDLMMRLAKQGPVHGKFRRMIAVYVDLTAPLYWWKEFDTYKVGTVGNSCSTMHKIHAKEFTVDDFSYEHLLGYDDMNWGDIVPMAVLISTIHGLNTFRKKYLETEDKKWWWQMIQLLPSSYNQRRTEMLNYEVLSSIYQYRRNHKLDEWHDFCHWIEQLPYSEIITCNAMQAT